MVIKTSDDSRTSLHDTVRQSINARRWHNDVSLGVNQSHACDSHGNPNISHLSQARVLRGTCHQVIIDHVGAFAVDDCVLFPADWSVLVSG